MSLQFVKAGTSDALTLTSISKRSCVLFENSMRIFYATEKVMVEKMASS